MGWKTQMLCGAALALGGLALGAATGFGFFANLALMACGLLGILHPVAPEGRQSGSERENQLRFSRFAGAACLVLGLLLRYNV